MFSSKIKMVHSLMLAGFFVFSSTANAAVTTIYNFGNLLATDCFNAPNSFASNPFAQLGATNEGSGVWTFKLNINNNLFSSFGNNAFIGSMSFDFINPDLPRRFIPTSTFLASNLTSATNVITATSVASTSGTGKSGLVDIDFGTKFGQGSGNRLSRNDWVEWQVSGLGSSNLGNMYVHVQGIQIGTYCNNGNCSAKYTPVITAVPEPETYAMLLAGLGLLGFSARRRNKNI